MTQNLFIILFLVILVASIGALVLQDIFGLLKPTHIVDDVTSNHAYSLRAQEIEPIASNANTIAAHIERMSQGLPEPLEPDFGH
jgi:ABC-type Zn2+ transport system substrate-binding protein/surface adhesin